MPWFVNGSTLVLLYLTALALGKSLAQTPEVVIETTTVAPTAVPCRSVADSFDCYTCKTNSHSDDDYCGDPFNSSHPEVTTTGCTKHEFCTKWLVQLDSGALQTTRTCSDKMQLNLKMYAVCMRESGSDTGKLCFCEEDLCNAGPPPLHAVTSLWAYALFVSACVLLTTRLAAPAGIIDCNWLMGNS